MKIIQEATNIVAKLWGVQPCSDVKYRLMRYVLSSEVDDTLLLYNVVTSELIALEADEKLKIETLPTKMIRSLEELVHRHFLVPVDFNEFNSVNQLRKLIKVLYSHTDITGYTILPTTFCNARCFYCYESGMKHVHMSEQIASNVADYIVEKSNGKDVSLSWFGGEPTVGMDRINQICRILCNKGIKYKSSMISNGLLLNEAAVETAVNLWNLKSIQITLDGTEEIYNRVKAYVTGHTNPFEIVLHNVELLLKKGIWVSIRLNLDRHNEEDLKKLVRLLKDRFSSYTDNCHVYVHVLFDNEGFTPVRHSDCDKKELIDKEIELNSELNQWVAQGKKSHLPALKMNCCMADGTTGVIIGPDGHISKCEHRLDEIFGTIDSIGLDQNKLKAYSETILPSDCERCILYPSCIKLKICSDSAKCDWQNEEFNLANYRHTMQQIYRNSLKC